MVPFHADLQSLHADVKYRWQHASVPVVACGGATAMRKLQVAVPAAASGGAAGMRKIQVAVRGGAGGGKWRCRWHA